MSGRMNRVELRENVRAFFHQGHSLRASSRIWASEASLQPPPQGFSLKKWVIKGKSLGTRLASLARTLARSHEARFSCPNRRATSYSPYRMSANTGSSHSHILSYSSPTVMFRCLAINAIAASHGFSTRLSRKRISCGAKPSFSASCFHSCPPTKRNNTIFFKGI